MTRACLFLILALPLVGCRSQPPQELPGAFGVLGPGGGKLGWGKLGWQSSSSRVAPQPRLPSGIALQLAWFEGQLREAKRLRRVGRPGQAINVLKAVEAALPKKGFLARFRPDLARQVETELEACLSGPIPLEPKLIELVRPAPPPGLLPLGPAGPVRKQVGP